LRQKVALTAIAILALLLFLFVPFAPESIPGPVQLPCYSLGTCPEGVIHFTVSLSCYLTGDSPRMFVGDSYSPQISDNGSHLFFGCHLGNTVIA
jgi:hypothetical protein